MTASAQLPSRTGESFDHALPVSEIAERERLALAQTLHDTLCQSLSGLQLLATLAERKAARQCPALVGDLAELRQLLGSASLEIHQLVGSLRGPRDDRRDEGDASLLP